MSFNFLIFIHYKWEERFKLMFQLKKLENVIFFLISFTTHIMSANNIFLWGWGWGGGTEIVFFILMISI